MMIAAVLLLICHFLSGHWMILAIKKNSFKNRAEHIFLSILLGMGLSSVSIFLIELLFIPINAISILGVHAISLIPLIWYRDSVIKVFQFHWNIRIYEIIPLIVIILLGVISVWRTIYFPPYSYDSMVGIDRVAVYAVQDQRINGSLFNEVLKTSQSNGNQLYYAPFTMLMQVGYRAAGLPFGQVWLGFIALIFFLFFYTKARQKVHPLLAAVFTLLMISCPEFYAYSFILQTDFSNAIYFFIGVLYFDLYIRKQKSFYFWLSVAGMFFACWSRTETIFFLPLGSLFLLVNHWVNTKSITKKIIIEATLYTLIPVVAILLWNGIYLNLYLPPTRDLSEEFKPIIGGLFTELMQTLSGMNERVVFRGAYWNYIVPTFLIIGLLNLYFSWQKKNWQGIIILYWIFVLYFMFAFLIVEFPAATINNTFRRGFFKFIPLLSLFLLSGSAIQLFSKRIKSWAY